MAYVEYAEWDLNRPSPRFGLSIRRFERCRLIASLELMSERRGEDGRGEERMGVLLLGRFRYLFVSLRFGLCVLV